MIVDRDLLAIGRSVNSLSSEQIHHQEEMLSKFIYLAENEEDFPYVTGGDDDADYIPIHDVEMFKNKIIINNRNRIIYKGL